MSPVGELKVVDLVGVFVGDLDDELVTSRNGDGAGVVFHPLGSDVDCRGVTGGGDVPDDRCRTIGVVGGCGLVEMVTCLLYTSPSPRDVEESRMPSSA